MSSYLVFNSLDDKYQRNAHIIYSAKNDFQKEKQYLNADDKGNLYRMGKLERSWIKLRDWATNGKASQAVKNRVTDAVHTTLDKICTHLNRVYAEIQRPEVTEYLKKEAL